MPLTCRHFSVGANDAKGGGPSGDEDPVFLEYRGVKIGWFADQVRKKLGSACGRGRRAGLLRFRGEGNLPGLYDKATRKVTAISVDFMNGARNR